MRTGAHPARNTAFEDIGRVSGGGSGGGGVGRGGHSRYGWQRGRRSAGTCPSGRVALVRVLQVVLSMV